MSPVRLGPVIRLMKLGKSVVFFFNAANPDGKSTMRDLHSEKRLQS